MMISLNMLTVIFISRIENLSNVVDTERLIYAVEHIPTDTRWGIRQPLGLNSQRYITLGKTNDPITIYMVGNVSQIWFAQRLGTNRPASLYIVPVTEGTTKRAHTLLTNLCNPPVGAYLTTSLWYGNWLTTSLCTVPVQSMLTEIQFTRFMQINSETGLVGAFRYHLLGL